MCHAKVYSSISPLSDVSGTLWLIYFEFYLFDCLMLLLLSVCRCILWSICLLVSWFHGLGWLGERNLAQILFEYTALLWKLLCCRLFLSASCNIHRLFLGRKFGVLWGAKCHRLSSVFLFCGLVYWCHRGTTLGNCKRPNRWYFVFW